LARQSIEGNLPPSMADAPPEMQPELLSMQTLSIAELQQIVRSQIPAATQERHVELLEKNSQNTISADERQELASLRIEADRLMLRKAHAWSLLRWRGQPIPPPGRTPNPCISSTMWIEYKDDTKKSPCRRRRCA
jgi:hypothetical protein